MPGHRATADQYAFGLDVEGDPGGGPLLSAADYFDPGDYLGVGRRGLAPRDGGAVEKAVFTMPAD